MNKSQYNFMLPRVLAFAGLYSALGGIAYLVGTEKASPSQIVNAGIVSLLGAAGAAIGTVYVLKEESLENRTKTK